MRSMRTIYHFIIGKTSLDMNTIYSELNFNEDKRSDVKSLAQENK